MGTEGDLVEHRLARGCRCFVAWIDGGVGGYGWLSSGPEWIGEVQLEIRPRTGEGYLWNCVTLPGHRRKGIFRSLLIGVGEHVRKEGLHRLWVGSIAMPAEKAMGQAGFRPALRFTSMTLAGFQIARVDPTSDRALADAASSVLGSRARLRVWRSHPRRH
ncbi:MAG TPA: GNAT family N-acetyltransferase [Candidatus Limnocylindrales bacterium]|nr:GNAT family N-acetyltransferase [Candidatus Limnocylindrales bacterium]